MALSGSVNFNMDAQALIDNAFSRIGVKKMEQPLIAAELQDGIDNLNLMMKAWQAQGLHLWSMEEGVLFLDTGVKNCLAKLKNLPTLTVLSYGTKTPEKLG